MTGQLRSMMDDLAGAEESRFNGEHRGDEATVYARAIAPRRAARRALEVTGGLAVVAAIGVGIFALAPRDDTLGPAVDTPAPSPTTSTTASPSATAGGDQGASAGALPGEPGWEIEGLTLDPEAVSQPPADTVAGPFAAAESCLALEPYSRLEGGRGAVDQAHLGGFAQNDWAVNDVYTRTFGAEGDAEAYADEFEQAAGACVEALDGTGMAADVSRVALTGLAGEAVTFWVQADGTQSETQRWTLWLHVTGTDAIAVVSDPGAVDHAVAIIGDLLRNGEGAGS